jgi:hypothetical protein
MGHSDQFLCFSSRAYEVLFKLASQYTYGDGFSRKICGATVYYRIFSFITKTVMVSLAIVV